MNSKNNNDKWCVSMDNLQPTKDDRGKFLRLLWTSYLDNMKDSEQSLSSYLADFLDMNLNIHYDTLDKLSIEILCEIESQYDGVWIE